MLGLVRWYQRGREGRPSPCRFTPSCSSYALEAIETHGSIHGGFLTVQRLMRCRPFGPSGYDPVPPKHGPAAHDQPGGAAAGAAAHRETTLRTARKR